MLNFISNLVGLSKYSKRINYLEYNSVNHSPPILELRSLKSNDLTLQSSISNSLSTETILIKKLFKLKKILDSVNYISPSIDKVNTSLDSGSNHFRLISSNDISVTKNTYSSDTSVFTVESLFSLAEFDTNLSKAKFSESSIKKLTNNFFLSSVLEDSIESTQETASSNR
jgi:hypothetical protein